MANLTARVLSCQGVWKWPTVCITPAVAAAAGLCSLSGTGSVLPANALMHLADTSYVRYSAKGSYSVDDGGPPPLCRQPPMFRVWHQQQHPSALNAQVALFTYFLVKSLLPSRLHVRQAEGAPAVCLCQHRPALTVQYCSTGALIYFTALYSILIGLCCAPYSVGLVELEHCLAGISWGATALSHG